MKSSKNLTRFILRFTTEEKLNFSYPLVILPKNNYGNVQLQIYIFYISMYS